MNIIGDLAGGAFEGILNGVAGIIEAIDDISTNEEEILIQKNELYRIKAACELEQRGINNLLESLANNAFSLINILTLYKHKHPEARTLNKPLKNIQKLIEDMDEKH